MTPTGRAGSTGPAGARRQPKRDAILEIAIRQFAEYGYDGAKWADVAEAVGLGQTGLYHYFASKSHCLFTIMAEALRDHRDYFAGVRRAYPKPFDVITASFDHAFEDDELMVLRYGVLQSEISLLAREYDGSRRERAKHAEARGYARDLARDWTGFLEQAMRDGAIPQQDPYLLARTILGQFSQPFQWYRPGSRTPLSQVQKHVIAHALAAVYHGQEYLLEPGVAGIAPAVDAGAAAVDPGDEPAERRPAA